MTSLKTQSHALSIGDSRLWWALSKLLLELSHVAIIQIKLALSKFKYAKASELIINNFLTITLILRWQRNIKWKGKEKFQPSITVLVDEKSPVLVARLPAHQNQPEYESVYPSTCWRTLLNPVRQSKKELWENRKDLLKKIYGYIHSEILENFFHNTKKYIRKKLT